MTSNFGSAKESSSVSEIAGPCDPPCQLSFSPDPPNPACGGEEYVYVVNVGISNGGAENCPLGSAELIVGPDGMTAEITGEAEVTVRWDVPVAEIGNNFSVKLRVCTACVDTDDERCQDQEWTLFVIDCG